MLGAQPLSGLASLINWTNSASYQRPVLETWGHIVTSNNSEQVALAERTAEPSTLAAGVDASSKPTLPDVPAEVVAPAAEQSMQAVAPASELVIAEAVSPEPVSPEPVPPQSVSPEPVLPKSDLAKSVTPDPVVAKSVTPTPTQPTTEVVLQEPVVNDVVVAIPVVAEAEAEKVVKEEPKRVATPEQVSLKKAIPLEHPQPEIAPSSDTASPTQSHKPTSDSTKPVVSKPPKTPAIVPPPVRTSVTPQRLAASSMPEWKPNSKVSRPTDSNSTGDEYLRQLERLIIELNMELGMREGDSPSQETDQMSLLVQRMIDLNLQNLALKEQLREAASPTL